MGGSTEPHESERRPAANANGSARASGRLRHARKGAGLPPALHTKREEKATGPDETGRKGNRTGRNGKQIPRRAERAPPAAAETNGGKLTGLRALARMPRALFDGAASARSSRIRHPSGSRRSQASSLHVNVSGRAFFPCLRRRATCLPLEVLPTGEEQGWPGYGQILPGAANYTSTGRPWGLAVLYGTVPGGSGRAGVVYSCLSSAPDLSRGNGLLVYSYC